MEGEVPQTDDLREAAEAAVEVEVEAAVLLEEVIGEGVAEEEEVEISAETMTSHTGLRMDPLSSPRVGRTQAPKVTRNQIRSIRHT